MASIIRSLRPLSRAPTVRLAGKRLAAGRPVQSAYAFSTTPRRREVDISELTPTPITHLSETESLMADSPSTWIPRSSSSSSSRA
ncbi:hypothetical protein DTO013F2_10429 [Penicillium roqueforti]|nr:hypothetical protein DTO013F2_10429 [Penicillium roqueforti]